MSYPASSLCPVFVNGIPFDFTPYVEKLLHQEAKIILNTLPHNMTWKPYLAMYEFIHVSRLDPKPFFIKGNLYLNIVPHNESGPAVRLRFDHSIVDYYCWDGECIYREETPV